MKGRGMPVTGSKPRLTPMLTEVWQKIKAATPIAISLPWVSSARWEIAIILHNRARKRTKRMIGKI